MEREGWNRQPKSLIINLLVISPSFVTRGPEAIRAGYGRALGHLTTRGYAIMAYRPGLCAIMALEGPAVRAAVRARRPGKLLTGA